MEMIQLPKSLEKSIQKITSQYVGMDAGKLRDRYNQSKNHKHLETLYLQSRMPATYTAIMYVLQKVQDNLTIRSAFDIGCGPGTGLWALRETFKELENYTGFEADSKFIALAKKISEGQFDSLYTRWIEGKYPDKLPQIDSDLVLMSYTLNENSSALVETLVKKLWGLSTSEWFVIVEPGTPKGYQSIMTARNIFVELGAFVVAPCVGNEMCPLQEQGGDWCHFSARLSRPTFQKRVKSATLNFEDEKISYLIVRRSGARINKSGQRVIKRPMKRSGHITLDLCSQGICERTTVTKSQKLAYLEAKDIVWGDAWNKDENV